MRALYHAVVSIVIASGFIFHRNICFAALIILFGVLIDIDHEIDYFVEHKCFTLSAEKLSEPVSYRNYCLIPLHSIEFLAILYILGRFYPVMMGGFIGASVHIIIDKYTNGMKSISFLQRMFNGFWRGTTY